RLLSWTSSEQGTLESKSAPQTSTEWSLSFSSASEFFLSGKPCKKLDSTVVVPRRRCASRVRCVGLRGQRDPECAAPTRGFRSQWKQRQSKQNRGNPALISPGLDLAVRCSTPSVTRATRSPRPSKDRPFRSFCAAGTSW